MYASCALAFVLLLQPGPDEPLLPEEQLIAVERRVEAIQKEFRDNELLRDQHLEAALNRAEIREGRVVEIFARVVRVDEDRVHVRFFRDLGDARGPLVRFLDKRDGEFVGGTISSSFLIGPTAIDRSTALKLRSDDLLRIRGRLASIELAPRDEQADPPRATGDRSVKFVIATPNFQRIDDTPARVARPVVPPPLPPGPLPPPPLPPGSLPPPPPVPPLPLP